MTPVRIDVTLDDISRGERCKFTRCAIALAAGRAFPGLEVGVSEGLLCFDQVETTTPLPDEALAFVRAFDSGCHVKPFSFEVNQPC